MGNLYTKRQVEELLFQMPFEELQSIAFQTRQEYKGTHVFLRGLLEFSNYCQRNCLYCGLQAQNKSIDRYVLTAEEIIEAGKQIKEAQMDTIVLQAGEWKHDPHWLAQLIKTLKEYYGLAITLCVGETSKENYALWKTAGADRYLLRHETADSSLYAKLHPNHTLKDRVKCLYHLKELGYEVGSGFLVGVPWQDEQSLLEDIMLVQELGVAMCGIGPFIPQKATPFADKENGSFILTLRAVAALRIVMPWLNLPATTALETLYPNEGQKQGLRMGANVLMPSFTPEQNKKNYAIYNDKAQVKAENAKKLITELHLTY